MLLHLRHIYHRLHMFAYHNRDAVMLSVHQTVKCLHVHAIAEVDRQCMNACKQR